MYINDEQLTKYLIDKDLIKEKDLSLSIENAAKHNVPLIEAFVHTGNFSEEKIREIVAEIKGVSFIDLSEIKIEQTTLQRIPESIAKKHNIIAFKEEGGVLSVATLDIDNLPIIDSIRKSTGLKIVVYVTNATSMQSALVQYRRSLNIEFDDIIKKQVSTLNLKEGVDESDLSPAELKKMAEDLPIIKIVDTLISHAILQNASDVHIEPEENSLIIRFRVDGILHDAMSLPKQITPGVIVRIKVLANLRLDEKRLPQDGRFKTVFNSQDVSFRVSILPTYFGEKVVIRILRESAHGFSLEAIGLHGEGLEHVHEAMSQKTGLILVSGPTGSGKTTTLYTMLDILNTTDVNISTVEDPIEYQVDRINQTQVRSDIGLTFAAGLRSLLRQDPDILMVGEIRDKETVSLAVNAALTGHLVLSTIHTNSAAGVIPRMIDMGIETFLITSTIKTISAQRLVRVLCDSKEKYHLSDEEKSKLEKVVDLDKVLSFLKKEKIVKAKDTWKTIYFYKAVSTPECESGYSGRIGIHEVLHLDEPIKKLITSGATESDIEEMAVKGGMLTMIEDGIFKAVQGMTTTEEVLRVVSD